MERNHFKVTVAHEGQPWGGEHEMRVDGADFGNGLQFYATAEHFGQGKLMPTPRAAIVSLVHSNGGNVAKVVDGIVRVDGMSDKDVSAVIDDLLQAIANEFAAMRQN